MKRPRDILIDWRFHKAIIGPQGSKIREIRDKFNQVQISFPDSSKQSDVVSLRGLKNEVDKCYKYLQQIAQEVVSHQLWNIFYLVFKYLKYTRLIVNYS